MRIYYCSWLLSSPFYYTGEKGEAGLKGPQGLQGPKGDSGPPGPVGMKVRLQILEQGFETLAVSCSSNVYNDRNR